MGKGGSSSKNYTYNTIDVQPITNVDIDVEEIANAIKDSSGEQLEAEKVKLALATAGLKLEEQRNNLNFLKDEKTRNQLTILALLIGGSYIYKHLKKGKK